MDQAVLVEQQQEDGKRLVEQLDRDGVSPTTAVWYYYSDIDGWRLLLAGRELDARKLEETYGKVARSLGRLVPPAQSMSIADIKIMDEKDPLLGALRAFVQTGMGINFVRLGDIFING